MYLLGATVEETTSNYIKLRQTLKRNGTSGLSEDAAGPTEGRAERSPSFDPKPQQPTAARPHAPPSHDDLHSQRSTGHPSTTAPPKSKHHLVELEDERLIDAVSRGVPLEVVDGEPRVSASYVGDVGTLYETSGNRGGEGHKTKRGRKGSRSHSRPTSRTGRSRSLSHSVSHLDNPIYEGTHRIYTPGPGTYELAYRDHKGGALLKGTSVGFAQSGRTLEKVLLQKNESPGPVYYPKESRLLATRKSAAQTVFGKYGSGSRFSATFGEFHNAPMFNPGPGTYRPSVSRNGRTLLPNGVRIGTSDQYRTKEGHPNLVTPTPVYYSRDHERENYGVHSPGPAAYNPQHAARKVKESSVAYSFRTKGITKWDEVVHPRNTYTPGPIYTPRSTRKGKGPLGVDAPNFRFGHADQRDRPEERLSKTAYISEDHARVTNYTLHAPPFSTYTPQPVEKHVASPTIKSGPPRLYNRFELGRI